MIYQQIRFWLLGKILLKKKFTTFFFDQKKKITT